MSVWSQPRYVVEPMEVSGTFGIFSKPYFFHPPPRAGRFEALNHVLELFPEREFLLRLAKNRVTRKPFELQSPRSERSQGRSQASCPAVHASVGQSSRTIWAGRQEVDFAPTCGTSPGPRGVTRSAGGGRVRPGRSTLRVSVRPDTRPEARISPWLPF